jgi:hypothetical protein
MKHTRSVPSGIPWACLAATALLIQGCAPRAGVWNGIFAVDVAGGARTCSAPTASPPDGQAVAAVVQVSNEGGWCGMTVTRGGVAYDSYLLVNRPAHGKVYTHHVGTNTRIDYTPDTGFTGTDKFAVRLIPGNAVVEETVTITR